MKLLDDVATRIMALGPKVQHHGVLGVYHYVDDVVEAVTALRKTGHSRGMSVLSPVPHHDVDKAMEQGPSLVRWITFTGAVLGVTGGFTLCIYSMYSWPLVVGGKELTSLPPFVVIAYESMILLGALANLFGMLALARLPQVRDMAPYDPRFSEDRIGIWVPCRGDDRERVRELMKGHGAEEVQVHG